ncbi:YqjF family protein [Cohnella herbarum]|uniref:DUF2071 domain-containing protein n=1 Tax=Cohnella herbarum TaxID=2728023 RepID=A0A7Z2VHD2_9BACL|nr:DUF2071 domain-containing protein [Cohnella herbarum]QJD83203.1 DUF2071 domain-containing protein [Cohnella herbarum]
MRSDHRPWPVPSKPWRMKQIWHNLLFAHWPIAVEKLRPFIPSPLKLDVHEGQAWIGVIPFRMSGIRLRYLPPIPLTSKFAEINVRTYVTIDDKPGVYFFSLDATHLLAVKGAKALYHLPYYWADIKVNDLNGTFMYESKRRGTGENALFHGIYKPVSTPYATQKGALDHWLTERYCLYSSYGDRIFRCEILHHPWPLQHAEAEIYANTMTAGYGIQLPAGPPILHYSERLEVLTWGLEEVKH